ncbi:RNA-directed DNA polymerase (Reverse transcriptase), Ribonuclease H-like protein [Gossypium australe]|uniref:RNA-directed DNA polymerase (Reverse transcriptase), Ribonuclease H-like protein n=1 Tax=Gossypium australe TaxID=47621 RepID=A0A5B6WG75_9ROSI|nr:RNA-directed DNA polymerase (Reverse transcriptase), Ribonuclease H-like protein [Gossypium australe]
MSGEMIEIVIRCGKIKAGESTRRLAPKKRKNEEPNMKQNTEKLPFTPIPMTYRELYKSLFDAHVVAPFYFELLQLPYPKWYDTNAHCEYHTRIVGHSIENCTSFKRLVKRLIKVGVVKFDDALVRTPLREVWKEKRERGLVLQELGSKSRDARNYYEFHNKKDHEIQRCSEFRALVQGLMDNKELEFFGSTEGDDVCTTEGGSVEKFFEVNHPVVIITRSRIDEAGARVAPRLNVTCSGKEGPVSMSNTKVEPEKRKSLMIEQGEERMKPLVNELVTENEAKEFLKFLKHSEYSVMEHLHKQPTRILVLALLLNSEVHRSALMKVLNETYVADDISVNKLDRIVSNISADNFISFSDDEISLGGMISTKALHITTRCKGYTLPGVLIDNGSALNVLSLSTLNRLPIDSSHMKTCQNIVRAFDGTERKVMRRIEIPLLIGPNTYEVDFLMMDIKPSYNGLLGRPWMHSAGAVPSSLHQKLKLVTEGWLITINVDEDIIASTTSDAPYIENNTEAIECSFRSLEPGNTNEEMVEDMIKTLSINTVFEEGQKEGNLVGICPYEPGSVLNNWTAEKIPVVFRTNTESPDIDVMSNAAMDPKLLCERDMCLKRSQNFTDNEDCSLSPDLLRMVEREEKLILPYKETIENVILEKEKEVKIDTCINEETRQDLIKLMLEFKDVFAWSYQDIPGLSTDIAMHRIRIKEECKPVQQKLRRMRLDVAVKIREEVKKQFDAGFLQVVNYSECVANVVPVPKKDGKEWMCVDYRDLNKASLKDNFPLPHIDTLVDNTTGDAIQVKKCGNQRAMVTLFHDMMHKEIEVYVDDMIAKSRMEKEHTQVLNKLFLRLRKFQLNLNPTKCPFGARSGKLLGFMVSEKGIEVDPDKVKDVQELPSSRTQKEVRGFLGRLNYTARFISQLTEKCDPIFRLLKKHNPSIWDDEC